jgi:hypothetical protein
MPSTLYSSTTAVTVGESAEFGGTGSISVAELLDVAYGGAHESLDVHTLPNDELLKLSARKSPPRGWYESDMDCPF